jgi:protein-disulfide isomerase-like protein with CxxC motif
MPFDNELPVQRETQAEWLRRTCARPARSIAPFTHERNRDVIHEALAEYDRKLAIERECMAAAMKAGDRNGAHAHRIQIARIENARKNAEERLRQLGVSSKKAA